MNALSCTFTCSSLMSHFPLSCSWRQHVPAGCLKWASRSQVSEVFVLCSIDQRSILHLTPCHLIRQHLAGIIQIIQHESHFVSIPLHLQHLRTDKNSTNMRCTLPPFFSNTQALISTSIKCGACSSRTHGRCRPPGSSMSR